LQTVKIKSDMTVAFFILNRNQYTLPDGHYCGSATHNANKINVEVINSKLQEILRELRVGSFIKLQHNSKDTIAQHLDH